MKQTLEREVKLDVEPGVGLPRPGQPLAPQLSVSRYFDTPDRRLTRHGVMLRCRTEERRPLRQVKLPRMPLETAPLELERPGVPSRLRRVDTREADLVAIRRDPPAARWRPMGGQGVALTGASPGSGFAIPAVTREGCPRWPSGPLIVPSERRLRC